MVITWTQQIKFIQYNIANQNPEQILFRVFSMVSFDVEKPHFYWGKKKSIQQ